MIKLRVAAAAVAALSVLAVSACSTPANSAAAVNGAQLSQQDLSSTVGEILVAQGKSPDAVDQGVTLGVINRFILIHLIDRLATENKVVVTEGDIDRMLQESIAGAGSEEALNTSLAAQGIAPSQVHEILRVNALYSQLLTAAGAADASQDAKSVVGRMIADTADKSDIEVNPRYGKFDLTKGSVVPELTQLATLPIAG